jgi:hypothetical protein
MLALVAFTVFARAHLAQVRVKRILDTLFEAPIDRFSRAIFAKFNFANREHGQSNSGFLDEITKDLRVALQICECGGPDLGVLSDSGFEKFVSIHLSVPGGWWLVAGDSRSLRPASTVCKRHVIINFIKRDKRLAWFLDRVGLLTNNFQH